MNDNKKILKYMKPTTSPLVIGGGDGSRSVKREHVSPQPVTGGLIIGTRGVVRPVAPPVIEKETVVEEEVVGEQDREEHQHNAAPEQTYQGSFNSVTTPQTSAEFDPNTARTIRTEKMVEEKMARAEQMLEEAEAKQRYANQQLEESQIKAKEIVKEAQMKAKKLIEDAKQYCQQLQAGAEREGFEQGREMGLQAGKQEAGMLMQQAMGVLNYIVEERKKIYADLEPQIADLALVVAKKVINTEITLNSEIVLNLIKSNLDKVKDREEITVRVNQDDYNYVKENEDIFRKMLEGAKKFRIEADGIVEKGGCMIDTNLGNLDARIEFQLEILANAFEDIKHREVE